MRKLSTNAQKIDRSVYLEYKVTQGTQEPPSFDKASHQEKHLPPWATAFTLSLTSVRFFVHDYLVEIEAIDEGPPDFTRCMCDELLFQHFLEGDTLKL